MTEQNKAKTNLIPKPIQRAVYASLSTGGFSFVFGIPAEYVPRIAVAGACYSLFLSWQELGKPKKKGRSLIINGERKTVANLEYSVPGYITRETWGETVQRWIYGNKTVQPERPRPQVERPKELDEFTFFSRGIQLREDHVKMFLKSAWRNRQYGRGLSERRWVREFSQRPHWYQELSTDWYYAMMQLLFNAQAYLRLQIVIHRNNNWMDLSCEPFTTMRLLKWYEVERAK